jgi:hypothetical protein
MYDLEDESANIWRELKQGSLGTVHLGMKRDKKAVVSFSSALQDINDPDAVALALSYPAWACLNCIGQLAYHQYWGDPSKAPFLEPRDQRWNPLRVMPENCIDEVCFSIASYPPFTEQAEKVLAHLVGQIKSEQIRNVSDADGDSQTGELHRHFLICLGVAFGLALARESKTLHVVLGDLVNLNQK